MTDFAEPTEYADLRAAIREITLATARPSTPSTAGPTRRCPACGPIWARPASSGSTCPPSSAAAAPGWPNWPWSRRNPRRPAARCSPCWCPARSASRCCAGTDRPSSSRSGWPRLADGGTKVVFAITEPDAGSNSHRITTTARRDGDDYLISGQKYYISGVDEAAAIITVTRTGIDPITGKAQLSLFLVPVGRPRAELEPARGRRADPGPAVHRVLRRRSGAGRRR